MRFRVPMMVWASNAFLASPENHEAFARLQAQQHAGAVHRHEELFDTLLGCLGYQSPNGGIKAENNWCQKPAALPPAVAVNQG